MFGLEPLRWADCETRLEDREVFKFQRLIERVDPDKVQEMMEESKELQEQEQVQPSGPLVEEPIAQEITYEEFMKVDLRVTQVAKAELVEGADKLVRLELDLGGESRTVLAGIRKAYDIKDLEGKKMIMVANLAPRKMKFGVSEGMILAAGPGGSEVFALTVDEGAQPGMRVH
jgi:methionyl-tRNA synthetase